MNEILYQSQQERRSDSRSDLKNEHLRVPVVTNSRSTSSSSSRSSSSSSSYPSTSQTAIAPSMQVDECNQDSSKKKQKVTRGADMELEGLVMESKRDRLQRYSDTSFVSEIWKCMSHAAPVHGVEQTTWASGCCGGPQPSPLHSEGQELVFHFGRGQAYRDIRPIVVRCLADEKREVVCVFEQCYVGTCFSVFSDGASPL